MGYIIHFSFLSRSWHRLSEWVKLTNQSWTSRNLSGEDVAATANAFVGVWSALPLRVWGHDLSVFTLRVVSVRHEWWIKFLFWIAFFLLWRSVIVAPQRFLGANLPQHVLHWRSLHVLQHSLPSEVGAAQGRWADSGHWWTSWKGVLLRESSSWWTNKSRYGDLLWNWN